MSGRAGRSRKSTTQHESPPEERRSLLLVADAFRAHRRFDDDGQSDLAMFKMLSLLERSQRAWKEASSEASSLLQRTEHAEEMEQKIRRQAAELKDARAQIEVHLTDGSKLNQALLEYEQKFALVQKILKDQLENLSSNEREQLDFLSDPAKSLTKVHSRAFLARQNGQSFGGETSILDDNIDYDQSSDSLEDHEYQPRGRMMARESTHRRSQSAAVLPSVTSKRSYSKMGPPIVEEPEVPNKKRSREAAGAESTFGGQTETTVTTTVTMNREGRAPVRTTVNIRRSMNRSMSESRILDEQKAATASRRFMTPMATSTFDVHTPQPGKSWTDGRPLEKHRHHYEKLRGFFRMTYCDVCQKGINFSSKPAIVCSDCHIHVHIPCKARAPLPCVPRPPPGTPKTPAKSKPRLQEFCPPTQPMIPHLIVHCVMALEKNHMNTEGLYRVPGSEKDIRPLLDQLKNSRALPNLDLVRDSEVIASCIKRFLKDLRDPLIPRSSREEFVRAALANNIHEMNRAICDLPQPNRDTLAFLIVHWQKVDAHLMKDQLMQVAERSQLNKMPITNLARVLGPTVVGERTQTVRAQIPDDVREASLTLEYLLEMETVYWERFLVFDENRKLPSYATPTTTTKTCVTSTRTALSRVNVETPRGVDCSFLGPITSPTKGDEPPLLRPIPRRGKLFDSPK